MRTRNTLVGIALTTSVLSGCSPEITGSLQDSTEIIDDSNQYKDGRIIGETSVSSNIELIETPVLAESEGDQVEQITIDEELDMIERSIEKNKKEPKTLTQSVPEQQNEAFIFPREMLFDGNKIADIRLTNPDGDVLVDMPLFVVTDLFNNKLVDEQLKRGAMLLVAHTDVNPGKFGDELGIPQMGLPGESEGVINNFGHNVSNIYPDFDGDITNGNEGDRQQVFYRLNEVVPGAELIYDFVDSSGLDDLRYVLSDTKVVEDVQPGGEGTGMGFKKAFELYGRSTEARINGVQLIKCEPANGNPVADRFVAFFEPAE